MSIWRFAIRFRFYWRDIWMGIYIPPGRSMAYICLLPMCVFEVSYMGKGYYGH